MPPNLGKKKVLCKQNERFTPRDLLSHFHNKPINGLEAPVENQSGVDTGVDKGSCCQRTFLSPLDGCYIIHKAMWLLGAYE